MPDGNQTSKGGLFLYNTQERVETIPLDITFASGAPNKEVRLRQVVEEIPESIMMGILGIGTLNINRVVPRIPINESNHLKTAGHLYWNKALQARDQLWESLPLNGVGISQDTHPKLGPDGKQLRLALVKHPDSEKLITYGDRLDALSVYAASNYGQFDRNSRLITRSGIGVVAWARLMLGMAEKKTYISFGKNPLPDKVAARDFLQMSAETHVGGDGKKNNSELQRCVNIPAGVPNEDLIMWAVLNKINVEVRGRTNEPLKEIKDSGNGFTSDVMILALEMAMHSRSTMVEKDNSVIEHSKGIKLMPTKNHSIIWSNQEQRLVGQFIGDYRI